MISSIVWIPAGVADPNPKKYELSAAEVELIEMIEMMEQQKFTDNDKDGDGAADAKHKTKKEKKKSKKVTPEEEVLPADLRMDEYSSDEEENDAVQGVAVGSLIMENALENAMDQMEPEEDTHVRNKIPTIDEEKHDEATSDAGSDDDDSDSDSDDDLADVPDTREFEPLDAEGFKSMGITQVGMNLPSYMQDEEEDDDSDVEDVQIQHDDAIVVIAKTEEDFASLEVNVYEQHTGNLFVHHDIALPSFPLCLAHGDISPTGTAGNFCAVGTFNPGIEIWNLDVLNALEPSCILGGEDTSMADDILRHQMGGKRMDKKAPGLRHGSHTGAVMALSWNKVHRQVIASGSADCTVKIWDVTHSNTDQCNAGTFSHHKDKVQSVAWHPSEGTLLATGGYDKTVALVDARSQDSVRRVRLPADCEAVAWDPFSSQYLTAASEDGTIKCWDVRKFTDKEAVWSVVAEEYGGVSGLCYNPRVPGMLASCAVDKTVTLWDTYNAETKETCGPPVACGNKDLRVGKLFSLDFYPSSPWLLASAGDGKEIALWDMTREDAVQKRFGGRMSSDIANTMENSTNEDENKESFNAMMENTTTADDMVEKKLSSKKKKSGGKQKKKKVHRAGR